VTGIRLRDFCPIEDGRCYSETLSAIFEKVKNAAYEIIERKGRTYYAIGLGLTRIVESIIRNESAILTVSSLVQDYYGVSDVCISVPTVIDRDGVREALRLPLEEEEIQQFQRSASILKRIIESLNL